MLSETMVGRRAQRFCRCQTRRTELLYQEGRKETTYPCITLEIACHSCHDLTPKTARVCRRQYEVDPLDLKAIWNADTSPCSFRVEPSLPAVPKPRALAGTRNLVSTRSHTQ